MVQNFSFLIFFQNSTKWSNSVAMNTACLLTCCVASPECPEHVASLSQNGSACSVFVADTSIVALSLCVWNEIIVVIHVACSRSVWCNTAANVYMLLGVAVSRITQTNIRIRKRDNTTRLEAAAKPVQGHEWTPQVTLWHCYLLSSLPKLTLFVNYCYFVILDNISKFI